ncbi:MAG: hypothetical protein BGO10_00230 [Chlamydia sp. 32-24]|nr:MAG: hypothetical protein BGO10_00230 [Chlamydia sp. 32-24]
MTSEKKTILLTAGRMFLSLDLARKFQHDGHRIIVAETYPLHICRFSNAVNKTYTIPGPKENYQAFISSLKKIVIEEKVDLFIPVFEDVLYLSELKNEFPCEIFCDDFEKIHELHHKWLFYLLQKKLGIKTPKTFLIEKNEDLKKIDRDCTYALKACYSRASLSIQKLEAHSPISTIEVTPNFPWITQEWIDGERFCSYSICKNGNVLAHSVYPVGYTIDGNSCIIFNSIHHEGILNWIKNFIKTIQFTGQVGFDFIIKNDEIYAIECNPRATAGLHLLETEQGIDKAFFGTTENTILAKDGISRQLLHGMALYGWRKKAFPGNSLKKFSKEFIKHKDVVYSSNDPGPLLSLPLIYLGLWKKSKTLKLPLPATYVYDYEWNGNESC